jgi:hypothetical protein
MLIGLAAPFSMNTSKLADAFLNGNRSNQPGRGVPRPDLPGHDTLPTEKDGTFISGRQFLGVNDLTIDGVTLWNVRSFGALIANASYVDVHDVIVDDGGGPDADLKEYDMTNGLHFEGRLHGVSIDKIKLRVGDDGIALNANDLETDDITTRNDFGPYVGQGPITDVTISNITFMPGQISGIRILSTNERIDRIVINNINGVVRAFLLEISHWVNPRSFGNVGSLSINNVTVDPQPSGYDRICFICLDGHIEALNLDHVITTALTERPLIEIGPKAAVGALDLEATLIDPNLVGNIVHLKQGGRVERMKLGLRWLGSVADQGKDPVVDDGGTIAHLQWIGTPPLLIQGHMVEGDEASLDVVLTQRLRSPVSPSGAAVTVNGQPRKILGAATQPDGKTIRYKLACRVEAGDAVAWSYDDGDGDLRNPSGVALHSVSWKRIEVKSAFR